MTDEQLAERLRYFAQCDEDNGFGERAELGRLAAGRLDRSRIIREESICVRAAFADSERERYQLTQMRTAITDENTRLRAALANSDQPCVYCTLPAEEWNKCRHGFPGCARADDAMGCPELGARMEAEELRAENVRLNDALAPFARIPSVTLATEGGPVMAKHYWTVIGRPDKSHFTEEDLVRARAAHNSGEADGRDQIPETIAAIAQVEDQSDPPGV